MLEACRTCLGLIDVDNLQFYEIEADDVQISTESCRYKLLSLIPEMALDVTPKSMICSECHESLEAMFEFKAKCLRTENIITQYFHAKPNMDTKSLDLKDVSAFNMSYVGDSKITVTEAFVEFVAVKEEPESSRFVTVDESITVVKHEVDNYTSESVEVLQPENTVLEPMEESEKGSFKCKVCSKSFAWRSRLKSHMLYHTDERPYKCTICTKGFNDKSTLNKHVTVHSEVKGYDCERCGKKLSSSKTLTNHMRLHNEAPNYPCELCDRRYYDRFQLRKHMGSHTKPYRCDLCDQRFGQKPELTVHMRKHTGEQPYTCTVCKKSFRSNKNLRVHKCTGFKEQPYQCGKCHKKFTVQNSLRRHMIMHTTNKLSFSCPICKKMCYWKSDVKRHIMKMHKDVDVDTVLIESCNTNVVGKIKEETQEK